MSKIKVMDEVLANKIAAGEVVEKTMNVVKELVENSIDAGSNKFVIEILNDGQKLIKISDNGFGMNKEDLSICLKRHATNKIKIIEDLEKIFTFEFRGEALAAISRVSKIEIFSREKNSDFGFKLEALGGENQIIEKVGMNFGTEIIVRDIFLI